MSDTTMGGVVKAKFTPKVGLQRQRKEPPTVTPTTDAIPSPQSRTSQRAPPPRENVRVSFAPQSTQKSTAPTAVTTTSQRASAVKARRNAGSVSATAATTAAAAVDIIDVVDDADADGDAADDDAAASSSHDRPVHLPFVSRKEGGDGDGDGFGGGLMLFQLPTALPTTSLSLAASSSSSPADSLLRVAAGGMGVFRRHLSGRQSLLIGDVVYDVTRAVECSNDQSVLIVDTGNKTFAHAGSIDARFVASIDVDDWTARSAQNSHARAQDFADQINKHHNANAINTARIKQER